jgi:hypothetical protein
LEVAAARGDKGSHDGDGYGRGDHEQRGEDGYLQAKALPHELRPDEDQALWGTPRAKECLLL